MRDEGSAIREKIRSSGWALAHTDTTIFSREGVKGGGSDFGFLPYIISISASERILT